MALIEAARFFDRNQAFIARATLLDAGVIAEVRDNGYANMMFGMAIATGGYPVLVLEQDVQDARALLEGLDPSDAEALDWMHHPQSLSGVPLAALGAGAAIATGSEASMLLGLKRRVSIPNLLVASFPILVLLGIFALYVVALLR